MWPVLLSVGSLHLYGYGAMITLGGIVSAGLLYRRREKIGLPARKTSSR